MASPKDRRYADSHEWHQEADSVVTLGLTQFAVDELTDITYVEMQPVGTAFGAGDSVGEVESVKATSDVYCAVGGQIVEVNEALADDPSLLNSDPHGAGWLIKLKVDDAAPLEALMDSEAYDAAHGC